MPIIDLLQLKQQLLKDFTAEELQSLKSDRVRASNDLYEALKTAITTIEYLHNMGIPSGSQKMMWALYQNSPEMTKINNALAKAEVKDA